MWPDGICRVTDTRYTKTIQYQDINYQLSQNEDKTAIFEAWCDFLNYFDSSVQFQLSFVNLSASQETFARSISIPPCGDEFDGIRAEYAGMLQNQLARGNNGLIKTKYLTFGVEADNLRAAKPRLERIETDLLNNFKRLGVVAAPLNGFERLHVMHDILRMDEQEPFRFSWDWLAPSGLSTKDFIAPSSFEFKTGRQFRMGKKLGAVSFVQILAPELNDRMLADFLDMESSVLVNLHVQSVDQVNAIKTVKRKITDLDKSKIEEQKKAVRADLPRLNRLFFVGHKGQLNAGAGDGHHGERGRRIRLPGDCCGVRLVRFCRNRQNRQFLAGLSRTRSKDGQFVLRSGSGGDGCIGRLVRLRCANSGGFCCICHGGSCRGDRRIRQAAAVALAASHQACTKGGAQQDPCCRRKHFMFHGLSLHSFAVPIIIDPGGNVNPLSHRNTWRGYPA